jgi:hypothetical protein
MVDYVVLSSYHPFAVIMQLHPGWVGFLQTQVLNSLNCLWFNRTQVCGGGGGRGLAAVGCVCGGGLLGGDDVIVWKGANVLNSLSFLCVK